jgi:hypothetical protein
MPGLVTAAVLHFVLSQPAPKGRAAFFRMPKPVRLLRADRAIVGATSALAGIAPQAQGTPVTTS